MNICEDASFKSITILSLDQATSCNDGALIVKGGAGICKNLVVGGCVRTPLLSSDKIQVTETITCEGEILPSDGRCDLGSEENRWGHIYGNKMDANCICVNSLIKGGNLEIVGDASLGKKCNGDPMVHVDGCNDEVVVNSDLKMGHVAEACLKENTFQMFQKVSTSFTELYIDEHTPRHILYQPCTHIVLVTLAARHRVIKLAKHVKQVRYKPGTLCRFVLVKSDDEAVTVWAGGKDILLNSECDFVEVMFTGENWVFVATN